MTTHSARPDFAWIRRAQQNHRVYASLSLLTLAALTPAKFEVEYARLADLSGHGALPDDYDLVAISSFSAQSLKPTVWRTSIEPGEFPWSWGDCTSPPADEAKEHCTSVVVGEGEPLCRRSSRFERGALSLFTGHRPEWF